MPTSAPDFLTCLACPCILACPLTLTPDMAACSALRADARERGGGAMRKAQS